MKHDYTKLDAAILESLKDRAKKFAEIEAGAAVRKESTTLELAVPKVRGVPYKEAFRFVDARLQAMRKSGKVIFVDAKTVWQLK